MYLKSERTPTETATTRTVLAIAVSGILEATVHHGGVHTVSVTTISDSVSEVVERLMMTMLVTAHWGGTQLERWEMMISPLALPA